MDTISWQVYEFEHNPKDADWFWAAGIFGVSIAVVAIIFGNILFGLLIIMSTVAIILLGNKEPHLLDCEINKKGVRVNKTLYPFMNLESFNVVEEPNVKLILKSTKFTMPLVTIPLGTVHIDDVEKFLSEKLLQEEHLREPFAHVIMEHLGF